MLDESYVQQLVAQLKDVYPHQDTCQVHLSSIGLANFQVMIEHKSVEGVDQYTFDFSNQNQHINAEFNPKITAQYIEPIVEAVSIVVKLELLRKLKEYNDDELNKKIGDLDEPGRWNTKELDATINKIRKSEGSSIFKTFLEKKITQMHLAASRVLQGYSNESLKCKHVINSILEKVDGYMGVEKKENIRP